jgi:hypothetical protein
MTTLQFGLIRQYRAGLKMLRECVEACPDDLWEGGHHPRCTWRIAYHGVFYADLYSHQRAEYFVRIPEDRGNDAQLWEDPPLVEPLSRTLVMSYIDRVSHEIEDRVLAMDLDSSETGIPWYKEMGKLEHQILNIRHLQGHVGQLSELLQARDIDTEWRSRA